jgi:hypothetical protein
MLILLPAVFIREWATALYKVIEHSFDAGQAQTESRNVKDLHSMLSR